MLKLIKLCIFHTLSLSALILSCHTSFTAPLCSTVLGEKVPDVLREKLPEEVELIDVLSRFEAEPKGFQAATRASQLLQSMPEPNRTSWILSLQRSLESQKPPEYDPQGRTYILPRRMIERTLLETLREDLRITEAIRSGQRHLDAYEAYVNRQLDAYRSEYQFGDIWNFVQTLQSKMAQANLPSGQREAVIYIGGSFPNGKARVRDDVQKKSDIDLTTDNNANLARLISEWVPSIQATMRTPLEINPKLVEPSFFAVYNPVIIKVTPTAVELLVYEPGTQPVTRTRPDAVAFKQPQPFPLVESTGN